MHVYSRGNRSSIQLDPYPEDDKEHDSLHGEAQQVSASPSTSAASAQRQRRTRARAATREVQQSLPIPHTEEVLLHQDPQRVLMHRILHSHWQNSTGCSLDAMSVTPPSAPAPKRNPSTGTSQGFDTTSEACVLTHPGTLACSRMEVTRDGAAKAVHITLSTTVRLTNSDSEIGMSDLESLGYLAGMRRLQDAAAQSVSAEARNARHEAILKILDSGRVVKAEKSTNQFGHPSFKLQMEDAQSGERIHALFKPAIEGQGNGWHRVEMESVAYHLNRLLGMDYVPPCVFKPYADVDWQHFELGGVFMYWAERGYELKNEPQEKWGRARDVVLSDARVLDVLIQNSDRHHGHFLFAEHWGAGGHVQDGEWRGRPSPVFIDHAAGLRPEAHVDMCHDNSFATGVTCKISARTFLRLRCMERSVLVTALGSLVTPAELDGIMRHRDHILSYFDNLIRERGYQNVVIEE